MLQLAQVATRQIEDADIRTHILDPTQASKAVDLSINLHYILINICQGAAATLDVNDSETGTTKEKRDNTRYYMEGNWNDNDYDNSWDWNGNSYEDTANYIGGINEPHLTIGHIRQAKSLLHKHKSKSLLGKKTTHTTSWNDRSKSFQQFL